MSPFRYSFLRLLLSSFLGCAMGKTLFVGSYSGVITTLSFDGTGFSTLAATFDSSPNPAWQALDGDILYSVSETWDSSPSVLHSFKVSDNGQTLEEINTAEGVPGMVSIAVVPGGQLLFTASYAGGGVSTFTSSSGTVTSQRSFTYTLASPGPNAIRQDAPHPHQALVDPSGSFALVPDLGADLVRVYAISGTNVTEKSAISVPAGFGPRHGVFWPKGAAQATRYYLIGELSNTIITYEVNYSAGNIGLTPVAVDSTYGPTKTAPAVSPTPTAGEIDISHDNKFLYATNRGDKTFSSSDSIGSYKIDSSGALEFLELSPAGGFVPRHFALDKEGDYVTIATQDSDKVSIFARNSTTGLVEHTPLAEVTIAGGPVCVTWLE